MDVTVLGSGNPIPDADRAGPAGLLRAGAATFLVDCGRGALMRLAAAGVPAPALTAVLLTHLHSDHTTDFNDVVTTFWIAPGTAGRELAVIGPPGTEAFVAATLDALATDVGYRITHHDDLVDPPRCAVTEIESGVAWEADGVRVVAELVDHGVVRPAVGYRAESDGGAVVWAGDTLPCPGLDRLCAGAAVYVQTVVRRPLVEAIPIPRFQDILDYHSDTEDAGRTAAKGGVRTLVLNHMVPPPAPGTEGEWIADAARHFDGEILVATDGLTVGV